MVTQYKDEDHLFNEAWNNLPISGCYNSSFWHHSSLVAFQKFSYNLDYFLLLKPNVSPQSCTNWINSTALRCPLPILKPLVLSFPTIPTHNSPYVFPIFYYNCQPVLIYKFMGFSVLFPCHHSIFKSTTYVGSRLELGYFWWMSVSWVVNYIMRYLRTMNNAGIFSVERCRSESKSRLKYSSWNAHQTHTLLIWKVPMLSLWEHGTLWGSDTD